MLTFGGAVVVTVLLGCLSAVPRVDAGLVNAAREAELDADVDRLAQGYETYRARCAGCHQLVVPGERAVEDWPVVVEGHRQRLALTDAEVEVITTYLQAGRALAEGQ